MKAQLSFEYMIAFGIFIGIVSYIYLSYVRTIPVFVEEVRKEAIRSDTFQISELLVNNPGEPADWSDASTANRIGFLDETENLGNLMSKTKILDAIGYCKTDYNDFRQRIGTDREFTLVVFDVNIQDGSRTLIDSCTPAIGKTSVNATIRRIATYTETNGEKRIAELIVQV